MFGFVCCSIWQVVDTFWQTHEIIPLQEPKSLFQYVIQLHPPGFARPTPGFTRVGPPSYSQPLTPQPTPALIRVLAHRDSPILWIDMYMPSADAIASQWPRAQSLNSQDCGSEGITPYIYSVVT
jgi:hypothetical protein